MMYKSGKLRFLGPVVLLGCMATGGCNSGPPEQAEVEQSLHSGWCELMVLCPEFEFDEVSVCLEESGDPDYYLASAGFPSCDPSGVEYDVSARTCLDEFEEYVSGAAQGVGDDCANPRAYMGMESCAGLCLPNWG